MESLSLWHVGYFTCWPVILLSKWSFYTVTYVPQLQNQHFILRGILECVLVGIIYPEPRWIIYTSRNTWGFLFSLPTLHSKQSCVHSSPILGLGDFWPTACCFHLSPRASSWDACYMDGTWICQSSPWSWFEICCSHGFHSCHSLWNSGILQLPFCAGGSKLNEIHSQAKCFHSSLA